MIRILQIGMLPYAGGIENYLMNYYRHIDKNRYQFDFINIYDKKFYFQDEIESYGGRIFKVSNYYKHPLRYIKEVSRIIKDNNFKIVHCNMNSATMLYPLIAAKIGKAKIIISHSHNSSSDKGLIKKILHTINKHFIPLFANKYFACSELAGKWFFSKKIRNSGNYFIINNAIDIEKFKFNQKIRKIKRLELGISQDTIVLGHVGRFKKQKNHEFLIDVFYEYHKLNQNSLLLLVGTGPLVEKIKIKVNNLNLDKSVLFLGQRDDSHELYQAMDCFILPSLYEGLPLVGIEALTAGLPCVFSDMITKEVDILNSILFINLKKDSSIWVKEISKYLKDKLNDNYRINNYSKIVKSSYNILIASKNLINIYISDENQ